MNAFKYAAAILDSQRNWNTTVSPLPPRPMPAYAVDQTVAFYSGGDSNETLTGMAVVVTNTGTLGGQPIYTIRMSTVEDRRYDWIKVGDTLAAVECELKGAAT